MAGQQVGSAVGATFGLVYVLVNTGSLPPGAAIPRRLLAGLAFVIVLIASAPRRTHAREQIHHGGFAPGYWRVVAAEVAALFVGLALLNGSLNLPHADVGWVSFVVGVHFVALARVFDEPFFRRLGVAITVCGLIGFVVAVAGGPQASVAIVSGVVPGALLLASGWWGTRQAKNDSDEFVRGR